jgi:hypothetical protein
MRVLTTTLIGFGLTLFLHVMAWRTFRPSSPARALVGCTFLASLMTLCLSRFLFPHITFTETLESLVSLAALAASYLISLPGLETDGPTFLILTLLSSRGSRGATLADLAELINDEKFVFSRLRSLETEGLVDRASGSLRITNAGRRFLRLFTAYHSLAGRTTTPG